MGAIIEVLDRRSMLAGMIAALASGCNAGSPSLGSSAGVRMKLAALEQAAGGRLGAYVIDTQSGAGAGWRADERFAHCSSFKLSLAAMVLALADRGEADLGEVLRWGQQDMLSVSPVTAVNIERGLGVEALARATLVTSDNTAANLLLRRFGGPQALTRFWRGLGDSVSRLDRFEPELNEVPDGTELDTTTPRAMATTTAALIQGAVLSPASTRKLKDWMVEVRTGDRRIRAGFPADWQSGDKTGTGIGKTRHTYVDLAFGGPQGRAPLVVAAYFEPMRPAAPMDPAALAVLADVGRIAAAVLQPASGTAGRE